MHVYQHFSCLPLYFMPGMEGYSFHWVLVIDAFFSRGLPPPQQQQMLSLRATNQPSLLSANPMLQRALLMQQMQGTVVMGNAYLLELFNHPLGLKPYHGYFLLNQCSSCTWQFCLLSSFFFFSPIISLNWSLVLRTEVLQLLKITCAQLFTTGNSTRGYQVRY